MLRRLLPLVLLALPLTVTAQETDQQRTDRGRIVAFIEDNLSGAGRQVTLRDFEGALSSRATAAQLTIADDKGVWLTVNDIVLDWNRAALLTGALSVNELTAGEIILSRAPEAPPGTPAPEASGFSLPDLPVSVSIDKISAAKVVLGESLAGQSVEATVEAALHLNGGQGDIDLNITRTDSGPASKIALKAGYDNATRQLAVDLGATEAAGGLAATLLKIPGAPALDLKVQGEGPLEDFAAKLALATEGQDRLSGSLELKGASAQGDLGFSGDLRGDMARLFVPEFQGFFGPNVALSVQGTKLAAGGVDLSALTLETRSLQLQGQMRIAADGLPERLDLTGRLADPNGGPVRLPTRSALSLTSADLTIGYDSRSGETWTARLAGAGLTTAQVGVPQFQLSGSGRIGRRNGDRSVGGTLRGTVAGMDFTDPRLAQALGADLTLTTRFWWDSATDMVSLGGLTASGPGLGLDLTGEIRGLSSGFRLSGQARVTADDLGRFSGFAGRPLSGSGTVTLAGQGSPLGGDFDLDLTVAGQDLGAGIPQVDSLLAGQSTLNLAVVRDPTGTELRRLALRTLALSLDGSGRLDSDQAKADLTFSIPDLGVAGPGFGGTASGSASLAGALLQGQADLTASVSAQDIRVSQPDIDRILAGQTRIDIAGAVDGAAVRLDRATLNGAQYAARLSGRLSAEDSDLAGHVDLRDLSVLAQRFGGSLAADFTAKGRPDQASLTLQAQASDLKTGIPEADGLLQGRTEASLAADLNGQALQIASATVTGARAKLALSGLLDLAKGSDLAGRIDLTDLAALRPQFGGSMFAEVSAAGTLQNGSLTLSSQGRNLRIGQPQADALLQGRSVLTGAVRIVDGQIRVDSAKLDNPQLAATASGLATGDQRSLKLDARLVNLALLLPEFPGPVTLTGTAQEQSRGYAVDLAGTGPGQINATVKGLINGDFKGGNLAISGTAQAGLANPFLGTRVLSGPVAVDLRLNGPFALASLSGRASLSNGRMADATLPFSLTGLSADIGLSGGRADVSVSAGVSSGGTLQVKGGIGAAAPFPADLGITISNVVVKDPQLYQTRANGSLSLQGPLAGGAVLSGRIALPETEIRIASTGLGGAGDLPDLRHVGASSAVQETRRRAGLVQDTAASSGPARRPYGLDLVISAPNRLFIRGRGLDAELGGELRVGGTSDNVIPSGAFKLIRGRLEILGRRLDLSQATMQLEGSFDPYLNIVASTEADGITANVVIEGQASDPKVSFTSSPQLPEEEVIAQILFGKRLQNLSALQAVQLANAVATLAGRGGEGVVSRLRKGAGLDDLDVQTNADGTAQVKAGKYLSKKVYSEVTVDQTGKSEISLNLDLTKNITVKGKVGADGDTGLGIYYEKDY